MHCIKYAIEQSQGCANGGVGGKTDGSVGLPIFSKLQESWSIVSHAAGEGITVFSMTFFLVTVVSQMVKMHPPNG